MLGLLENVDHVSNILNLCWAQIGLLDDFDSHLLPWVLMNALTDDGAWLAIGNQLINFLVSYNHSVINQLLRYIIMVLSNIYFFLVKHIQKIIRAKFGHLLVQNFGTFKIDSLKTAAHTFETIFFLCLNFNLLSLRRILIKVNDVKWSSNLLEILGPLSLNCLLLKIKGD